MNLVNVSIVTSRILRIWPDFNERRSVLKKRSIPFYAGTAMEVAFTLLFDGERMKSTGDMEYGRK